MPWIFLSNDNLQKTMDSPEHKVPTLTQADYDRLSESLADTKLDMEKRLRSVFTLRSLGNDQAVNALKPGILKNTSQKVLKHFQL